VYFLRQNIEVNSTGHCVVSSHRFISHNYTVIQRDLFECLSKFNSYPKVRLCVMGCPMHIVTCFLGNATRNLHGFWILQICLLDSHALYTLKQLVALMTSSDVSSSMFYTLAPLISVKYLLLFVLRSGTNSLALVEYKLSGLLPKLDCSILHSG
jgi:hypothetical protein